MLIGFCGSLCGNCTYSQGLNTHITMTMTPCIQKGAEAITETSLAYQTAKDRGESRVKESREKLLQIGNT